LIPSIFSLPNRFHTNGYGSSSSCCSSPSPLVGVVGAEVIGILLVGLAVVGRSDGVGEVEVGMIVVGLDVVGDAVGNKVLSEIVGTFDVVIL
jgi:hypothetical protein